MKVDELKKFLKNTLSTDQHLPIMIWSPPGIGKSSAVSQVAEELDMDFIDLRLSLLNPVDLRGLPTVDDKKNMSHWLPPEFLPSEDDGSKGILFLDEINLAPFSVMAAGYQLILDRELGEYKLPSGWQIVAAGNRAEDNANVTKFPAPLANRFLHLEVESDIDTWRKWALNRGIHEQILAFLGKFPQHLMYDELKAGNQKFPTPRTWELASKLHSVGLPIDSAVGEGVASEFAAFLRVYEDLPDVDKILAGKLKKVPKETDVLWALSTAILSRSKSKHIENILNYVESMPKEFEVLTIINLSHKSSEMEKALIESKGWKKWINKNDDIIEEGTLEKDKEEMPF